jgi:hypothetical protein
MRTGHTRCAAGISAKLSFPQSPLPPGGGRHHGRPSGGCNTTSQKKKRRKAQKSHTKKAKTKHLAAKWTPQHPLLKRWHALRPHVVTLRRLCDLLSDAAAHGDVGGVEGLLRRGAIRAELVERTDNVAVAIIDMASRRCGQERRDPASSDREGVAWHGTGFGTSWCVPGTHARTHACTHARTLARSVHFHTCMVALRMRACAHTGLNPRIGFGCTTWQRPFLHTGTLVVAILSPCTRTHTVSIAPRFVQSSHTRGEHWMPGESQCDKRGPSLLPAAQITSMPLADVLAEL